MGELHTISASVLKLTRAEIGGHIRINRVDSQLLFARMPRFDLFSRFPHRRQAICLAVVLIAGFFSAALAEDLDKKATANIIGVFEAESQPAEQFGPSQAAQTAVAPLDHPLPARLYQYACDKPQSREDADSCQQRRSAEAAEAALDVSRLQFWVAIGGTIASTVAAAFTAWAALAAASAAGAATDSAAEARQANILARAWRRAWLKIQLVPYREISFYDKGGLYSQITVSVTNIGASVASDVRVFIKAFTYEGISTPTAWDDAASWLVNRLAMRHPEESGRVLLPEDNFDFEPDLIIRPDEALHSTKPSSQGLILRVAAIAEYATDGVVGKRQTLAYFDVCAISDDGTSRVLIPREGIVPKEKIRVSKSNGGFAT